MWLSKKKMKGTSRRFARSALAALTLLVATLAGHSSPRGEELETEETSWRWTASPEVREALAPAASTLAPAATGEHGQTRGVLIPLTGIELTHRALLW